MLGQRVLSALVGIGDHPGSLVRGIPLLLSAQPVDRPGHQGNNGIANQAGIEAIILAHSRRFNPHWRYLYSTASRSDNNNHPVSTHPITTVTFYPRYSLLDGAGT